MAAAPTAVAAVAVVAAAEEGRIRVRGMEVVAQEDAMPMPAAAERERIIRAAHLQDHQGPLQKVPAKGVNVLHKY
jgi:hypothetical protein